MKTWSKLSCGFLRAVSKSPKSLERVLFQCPNRNSCTSEDVWYDNMVVGERTLGEKMKNITREAKLSKSHKPFNQGASFHNH